MTHRAVPVGAVSYGDIDGYRYKRDVLFCYDLKLPDDFIPKNQGKHIDAQLSSIVITTSFFSTLEIVKLQLSLGAFALFPTFHFIWKLLTAIFFYGFNPSPLMAS